MGALLRRIEHLPSKHRNPLQSFFRFTSTSKVFNNLGNLLFAQRQPKSPQRQGFCHGFATVHSGWIVDILPPSMAAVQRNLRPFDSPSKSANRHLRIRPPRHNAVSVLPSFRILFRQCDKRFVRSDL